MTKSRRKQEEEDAKLKAAESNPDVSDVPGVSEDGDVVEAICPQGDLAAKKKMCETLNKQERKRREEGIEQQSMSAYAGVLRNRLVVVDSLASAKLYMESSSKGGLKLRVLYVDFPD